MKRLMWLATVALGSLGFAPGAWAQSCVLCYTSAAASGPGGMHALWIGMFTLLIPALTLFVAVFVLIWHRSRAASAVA